MSKIICDRCECEFDLNSVNINESDVEIKGNKMKLRYFTCPNCNEIYKVCLMDEKYKSLVEELETVSKRIKRNRSKGNLFLQTKLVENLSIKQNRLKAYAEDMRKKYNGTFTFVASENNEKEQKIIYHE